MYQDRLMSGLPGTWKENWRFDTARTFSMDISALEPETIELSCKDTK